MSSMSIKRALCHEGLSLALSQSDDGPGMQARHAAKPAPAAEPAPAEETYVSCRRSVSDFIPLSCLLLPLFKCKMTLKRLL